MNDEMAEAVFGNVGSLLAFQVGARDAEDLTDQLGSDHMAPQDLMSLPKYTAYLRLLVDGMPSRPFSMQTLPPPPQFEQRSEIIRRSSRRRYAARPLESVQREIEQAFAA